MNATFDWSDVEAAAKEAAGNHLKFRDFSWHIKLPDDAENWVVVYSSNRDSGLLERSNADAIEALLEPFLEDDDCDDISHLSHNHWACGHVDGYFMRVYRQEAILECYGCGCTTNDDGKCLNCGGTSLNHEGTTKEITPVFKKWCEIQEQLADYPVLDESDYSQKEYDATLDWIKSECRKFVINGAPEEWECKVYSWLSDNTDHELENTDDTGATPSPESMRKALLELELANEDIFDERGFDNNCYISRHPDKLFWEYDGGEEEIVVQPGEFWELVLKDHARTAGDMSREVFFVDAKGRVLNLSHLVW